MVNRELDLWRPFRDLVVCRDDFDRLLDPFCSILPRASEDYWVPPVDIEDADGHIEVQTELPGMKKDDIKVSVHDNILDISGERKNGKEEKGKTYYRIERCYGAFHRTIRLPTDVESDKVKASYKDGLLNISIPKSKSSERKKIEVEVD